MNESILQERRVKRLRISYRFLLSWMSQATSAPNGFVQLPDFGLPEGAKLIGGRMTLDARFNAFTVYIAHPSFDEVPDFKEPPDLDASCSYKLAALAEPVSEEWLREQLVTCIVRLGVAVCGTHSEPYRRSASDLATDLAPLLAAQLNAGVRK